MSRDAISRSRRGRAVSSGAYDAPVRGRLRKQLRSLQIVLLAALLVVSVPIGPAQAASIFVSPNATPGWQVDGTVYATLIVGDTVYVGGDFKHAVAPDGSLVARQNLAAFSMSTGGLVTSFRADAASNVRTLATNGSGLYVGGAFLTLGGLPRSYIGKVNLVTGAVDPNFSVTPDGSVRGLAVSGQSLFVGGNFTHIGSAVRGRIAKVDAANGALDSNFTTSANNSVYALKLSPSGDRLYVGGNFGTLNGVARSGIGAVLPTTGVVTGPTFASSAKPTFALAVNEDGTSLFASGGSATNATGAWDTTSGTRTWRVVTDGDNQAMVYYRGVVYFGFHDGYQGDSSLRLLAADAKTGAVDPNFRPTFDQFWGVWALDISAAGLVAGGDFTSVSNAPTTGFARFVATSAPPKLQTTVSLLGPNTMWSFWDKGTRPSSWETPTFDSSAWARGVPRLGYGDTFDDTLLSYGASSTNKYLTYYFRASFDLTSIPDALNLELSADDGAAVYVNGVETARDQLPAGTLTNTTTALVDRSGGAETALTSFPVSPSALNVGKNVVAVEVHQYSKGSSDMGMDLQFDAIYDNPDTTNQPPVASFLPSMAGMQGSFDASGSSDPDGTVASYYWDFGDGTTDTGVNVSHTFAVEGDYQVTLSVLDDRGSLDTQTHSVTAVSTQQTLIQPGSSWAWKFDNATLPSSWNSGAFDSTSWQHGSAPLGFGDASVITKIDTFATTSERPKAAYFTKSVQVTDPSKVSQLVLSSVADDGVVLYVNGAEVGRYNMPTGVVTPTTSAVAAVRTASAQRMTVNVSPDLLVAGTNSISAETHLNYKGTSDSTFDLTAKVTTGNARPVAAFTSTSNELVASFDAASSSDADGVIASYAWDFGDGTTGSGMTTDHTYSASGTYHAMLTVTDADGALGSVTHDITVVTADPVVIPRASSWRWRYEASAPPVAWATTGFDASGWQVGSAVLGFGDASISTNIDSFALPSSRPITAQFLKTFQVADTVGVSSLLINTVADDGVVIFVNGVEVGRSNMPVGPIGYTTYASSARRTATANSSPVVVSVPSSVLVNGTNTVAVETHVNYKSTPDLSFALDATLQFAP